MADSSLPPARTPIESWSRIRDALAIADQQLAIARETLTAWFISAPIATWKQPFIRDAAATDDGSNGSDKQ